MSDHAPRYEFGIDIGGTFTDVVCRADDGTIRLAKLPTTRDNPSHAVLAALRMARRDWEVAPQRVTRFAHGTTVATNAVLERTGARVGLITTRGFKDLLEIGRQMRHQMYDLELVAETPVFLAPGRFRKEVIERLDAQGNVLVPLDEESVRRALGELAEQGVEAIAVCLLFSFLDPAHERRIEAIAAEMLPGVPVSLSCEVDPAFREYERTCVTAFDAYIKPMVTDYLTRMENGLAEAGIGAPLQVMQSRGGLMSSPVARRRPVRLFLSGPAAGVIGGLDVGVAAGWRDLITVDIGGTSCDIALISDGRPLLRPEGVIDGFTVRVPMVDVTAIGAGGGSVAWLDGAGSLRVGPHSAGSEPGPACYGRGGTRPTVTDASVVLGYLDPANFAAGTLGLQPDLAHAAIEEHVARPLGMSVHKAALGIHRVLNAQMAAAIRLVSIGRGIDPRGYGLLPLGGAGPMHATALAEELDMVAIIVPPHPGVLAAGGLLGAPVEHEVAAAFPHPLAELCMEALAGPLAALDARAASLMRQEGAPTDEVAVTHFADICYVGQSYHLEVPLPDAGPDALLRLYRDFQAAHDRIYGHHTEGPARIVNLRSVHRLGGGRTAAGHAARRAAAAPTVRRIRVCQSEDWVEAAIWERGSLTAETRIPGPAIIEQADTTTLVEPGWVVRPAAGGALLIEPEKAR